MRILVYRLGFIGDTLIALPCFKSIRQWFPDAHITWLTNTALNAKACAGADIWGDTGLVNEYIDYPLGIRNGLRLIGLWGKIVAGKYDLVINITAARGLLKSCRDAAFFASCGIRRQIGFPYSPSDLVCQPDLKNHGLYEPEARRLTRRLSAIGPINLDDRSLWSLNLTHQERSETRSLLEKHDIPPRFIAVSLGTKSDTKDWTAPNWISFISSLANRFPNLGLIVIGSNDEFERGNDCMNYWQGPKLNLCGRLTVRQSAATLELADLFVGHDSGPMHLAASVNTPCVAIFSAQNLPGNWYPNGKKHHVFYNKTECCGCALDVCPIHNKKCILGIKPEAVLSVVTKLLTTSLHTPPEHT